MREFVENFLGILFDCADDDAWDTYATPEAVIEDTENYLSKFTVELAKYLRTPEFKTFVTERWTKHTEN